jgi:hypothetical protein
LQAVEAAGQITGEMHVRGAKQRGKGQRPSFLSKWVVGPALDSVLASAARYAQRTSFEYEQFHREMADPSNLPKPLRVEEEPEIPESKKKARSDR